MIGQGTLALKRHLRIDAALGFLAGKTVAHADPIDLHLARHADDPYAVKHMRHGAFIQQRHIAEDERIRRVVRFQLLGHAGDDHRMQNAIERLTLFLTGKDNAAQRAPVEHAAVKYAVAKRLADGGQGCAARRSEAVGNGVRIGNEVSLLTQIVADRALAAGNAAGKSDFHR